MAEKSSLVTSRSFSRFSIFLSFPGQLFILVQLTVSFEIPTDFVAIDSGKSQQLLDISQFLENSFRIVFHGKHLERNEVLRLHHRDEETFEFKKRP